MKKLYVVLAYAPSGDMIRFLLIYRPTGIKEFASAARRQYERLKRKVIRMMDRPPHVTPLSVTAGSRRHRRHLIAVAAGMAAGLALVLAALVTRTAPLFWAGYGLAAAVWFGGVRRCRRRRCRPSESGRNEP